jgi:hypothetical protein
MLSPKTVALLDQGKHARDSPAGRRKRLATQSMQAPEILVTGGELKIIGKK